MKHFIHQNTDERIELQASRNADALYMANQKLNEVAEATRENNPKDVLRKLEEIKSASLITNQTLKKIEKKEHPMPEKFPTKMRVELEGIEVITIKGDKGDKGDAGNAPTEAELRKLIAPLIPDPIHGKDGKSIVGPKGDKGERGDSITGPKGDKGDKGEPGKDGSPDTPDEVAEKINTAEKKILISQIKGLRAILEELDARGNFPMGAVGGGGGTTELHVLTGAIDGSNTTFTFSRKPRYIVSDSTHLRENKGWTFANGEVTIAVAPAYDCYGLYTEVAYA